VLGRTYHGQLSIKTPCKETFELWEYLKIQIIGTIASTNCTKKGMSQFSRAITRFCELRDPDVNNPFEKTLIYQDLAIHPVQLWDKHAIFTPLVSCDRCSQSSTVNEIHL
jgi:hypothetical protein